MFENQDGFRRPRVYNIGIDYNKNKYNQFSGV